MKPQDQMRAQLERSGIPYKEIECYGSQIVVTSWSHDAAKRWARLLGRFATVRGLVHTRDYNEENRGTNLNPTTHEVWRTFACV